MKDIIAKYGILHSKRYSRNQKSIFIHELITDLKDSNQKIEIVKTKKQIQNSEHVMVNDPKNKSLVFVASYDTPSRAFLKSAYYPFNNDKNLRNEKKEYGIKISMVMICILFCYILLHIMLDSSGIMKIGMGMFILLNLILMYFVIHGIGSKYNYNRNSVAVSLLIDLIVNKKQDDVGYVFLDNATDSYKGFTELEQYLGTKKEIFVFNALADGEILVKASRNENEILSMEVKKNIPDLYVKNYSGKQSDNKIFSVFENMTVFISGNKVNNDFAVLNQRTDRDFHVDFNRLKLLEQSIINYINANAKK